MLTSHVSGHSNNTLKTLSLVLNLGTNVKDSTGPMTTVSDEELEPTQAYCMEIDGKGQTCNSVLMGKNPFSLQSISNFSKDQILLFIQYIYSYFR